MSPRPDGARRARTVFAICALTLALLPSLILARPLLAGAVPDFMDTVMYFLPLRVHASRLLAGGELPLWNRCLMGGMPLFENPQAALAYPLHWPALAWPGGFWFTFPMTLQLGAWAVLTAWALRRLGAGRAPALLAGALALTGGYGWSRLQYGNYLNVLPWWPLALGAAAIWWNRPAVPHRGRALGLIVAAAAIGMMLLAGAHQLAVYGFAALAAMTLTWSDGARRWAAFWLLAGMLGLLLGAPGWLPQLGFIRETSRAGGLAAEEVLAGTLGGWSELARALAGDWTLWRAAPAEPWADAESSAALGLLGIALAGVIPARGPARRAWLGCWLAAALGITLSLRPVMQALLALTPAAAMFHDPRRWLGAVHWTLVIAAGLGADALWREDRRSAWRLAPGAALVLAVAAIAWPRGGWIAAQALPAVAALAVGAVASNKPVARWARVIFALAALAGTTALGFQTWVTTDLRLRPARDLIAPAQPPLLAAAGLRPGERFVAIDWQRSVSYDFRRPDLLDWMLPNLAMLYGWEDLGGYEPAQTARYRAFIRQWHAGQPWRVLYPRHFGIVTVPVGEGLAEGNARAALVPRWGVPCYFRAQGPGIRLGTPPSGLGPATRLTAVMTAPATTPTLLLSSLDATGRPGPEVAWGESLPLATSHDLDAGRAPLARRAPPPGRGELFAANGPPPPGAAEPPWLARTGDADFIDLFAWDPAWDALWEARQSEPVTMLLRARGPANYAAWASGSGTIHSVSITANRVSLEVTVDATAAPADPNGEGAAPVARLIVHDAWWRGWRAHLDDGTPIAVRPDGLWRALDLPAGRHTVTMEYRPRAVAASFGLAAIGLLGLGWLLLRSGRPATRPA